MFQDLCCLSSNMLDCSQGPLLAAVLLVACAALVYRRLSNRVYLLDFACYRPADEYQVTWKRFMAGSVDCGVSSAYAVVLLHSIDLRANKLARKKSVSTQTWHGHTQTKAADWL